MRYLLDTGIAGLYLDRKRGVHERALAATLAGHRIGVTGPVLAELAYRCEGSPNREQNFRRLRDALDEWKVWLPDIETAFVYGRIAFTMKTLGRPIGQNDMMIAAVALALGNTVIVTLDSDLSAIPGLSLENWAAPHGAS